MKVLKRTMLTMRRLWIKNILLFFIILILGGLLTFTITAREAALQIERSVMSRLHPTMVIENVSDEQRVLTLSEIEAVGEVAFVRTYNATVLTTFKPSEYEQFLPFHLFEDLGQEDLARIESDAINEHIPEFVTGITTPYPAEFEVGLLELSEGRMMTQAELDSGAHVTLLPRLFAELNGLAVGDYLQLHYRVEFIGSGESDEEPFPSFHRHFEFEIVGLFDIEEQHLFVTDRNMAYSVVEIFNAKFVPFVLIEDLMVESRPYHEAVMEYIFGHSDYIGDEPFYTQAVFVLYDPRDMFELQVIANDILPDGWELVGTYVPFLPVIHAMDSVLSATTTIFVLIGAASAVALVLVIALSLKDRQWEFGTYLALGERKRNIVMQILGEYLTLSVLALGISLMLAPIIATGFSNHLLSSNIQQNMDSSMSDDANINLEILHFSTQPLEVYEIMELYDVSISIEMIGFVFIIGLMIVAVAAIIPILMTISRNPKEILNRF